MPASSSFVPMLVVAAALSAPVIVAAQPATTQSPRPLAPGVAAPATPAPATPTPATPAPSASAAPTAVPLSTYVTGDQRTRSSKLIGASVYNEKDEKIGSVDDVLISPAKEATGVVLSVGGFLGIASKLVEVPYSDISVQNDKLVMAGTTKDRLTKMPDYKYSAGL